MSEEAEKSETTEEKPQQQEPVPWRQFLKEYAVGSYQTVREYYAREDNALCICRPPLRLYCSECDGIRNFDGVFRFGNYAREQSTENILVYTCRDCRIGRKYYYLISFISPSGYGNGEVVKVGELPELSIRIPPSLPKLLGPDYDHFIKGLKCEKSGLGIGAYVYYRRVVESQKTRMLEEILKVAEKLNAKSEIRNAIKQAIKENQFTKAVNTVKGMLPESLLVDGHNPLKLIHRALSIGVHEETDETCLQLAHNVRLVLTDLAERIKLALSEQRELKGAVSSLMNFNKDHS